MAITSPKASYCQILVSSRTTAQLLAAHGFIVVCFPRKEETGRAKGTPAIFSAMGGDSHGRTIVELFITGHRRARMDGHGVSARSLFGGTKRKKNGQEPIPRISRIRRLQIPRPISPPV